MQIPMANPMATAPVALSFGLSETQLPPEASEAEQRRTKLWEIPSLFHCSIIGTCLTVGELRKVVRKVAGHDVGELSDVSVHNEGVRLASNQGFAGKLLQKALDRRHQLILKHFAKVKNGDELARLWNEAKANGEIPGAYWAVLTHPAATERVTDLVFGEVHMLSHLVGAANRADIRRLNALEAENVALHTAAQETEERLRTAIRGRDVTIRQLNDILGNRLARDDADAQTTADASDEIAALRQAVAQLRRRLSAEIGRRERAEQKAAETAAALLRSADALRDAGERERSAAEELAAAERQLAWDGDADRRSLPSSDMAGSTLLYVGGRPGLVVKMQTLVARLDLRLLHHDGGIEDKRGLLAGMVGRAEAVLFPIDCVSHDAVGRLKRLCRQADKPYVPLRNAGMASFLAGLERLCAVRLPAAQGA